MPPSPPSSDPPSTGGIEDLPAAHAALPERLSPAAGAVLARILPDARRRLSPRGLDAWLAGAGAVLGLGRGEAVVRAWLEAMPEVARELGEDIVADTAVACLGFASRTSGAVIARILETAPLAARRLGDAGLFRSWLRFLEHLLARAPRALRPMLDHLGDLLDVLTLGGLRRWADWGVDAHRSDPPALEAYFALASEDSRAVLKAERKGVLLVDVQRRIGMYLRALWGCDFVLVPTAGDFETRAGLRPFAADHGLHLPDALDDWCGIAGLELYRAQAAHLAAHLAVLTAPIPADGLNAFERLCVGLVEDARAEAVAIARFPNLRRFWARFHAATAAGTAGVFDRIARALLTGAAEDEASAFALAGFAALDLADAGASRAFGLSLARRLGPLPFSPHGDRPSCPYRCDNRILWDYEAIDWSRSTAAAAQTRRRVSVSEMVNEVEVETAGDDAQEIWVQSNDLLDDDGSSLDDRPRIGPPVVYEEFDHTIRSVRPAWVTLREVPVGRADPARADAILAEHRQVGERLRRRLDAMRPQGVVRVRKLEDGDELDLDAAVAAAVDSRLRRRPDPRVMMRRVVRTRDTAVMVLLDLSESTNDPAGDGRTVLDLTRAASLLLAEAIDRVGDAFALHGFASDGRTNVVYSRLKDFDDAWGVLAKARIMAVEGRLSTRMGAGLRHATTHLARREARRKLLLVLTDGAPADIDVRDPLYLLHDARHAVDAARRAGIVPFCLTLDPRADSYAQRIFGGSNVQVLDRVERLPERLPALYASLTR